MPEHRHPRLASPLALVLAAAPLAACIAPTGAESTDDVSQAQSVCFPAKNCMPPPPPPSTCSYNPLTTYPIRPATDPVIQNDDATVVEPCIPQSATDARSVAERTLIETWGCSLPVYIHRSNVSTPSTDWWNAYALLCPIDNDLEDYVDSLNGGVPLPAANVKPHYNFGYADLKVPLPPLGLFWVVPWQDPTCMDDGGCMVTHCAM
jgi:hypothetical protein